MRQAPIIRANEYVTFPVRVLKGRKIQRSLTVKYPLKSLIGDSWAEMGGLVAVPAKPKIDHPQLSKGPALEPALTFFHRHDSSSISKSIKPTHISGRSEDHLKLCLIE